jgi:phosphate transport system substrate-binding protein
MKSISLPTTLVLCALGLSSQALADAKAIEGSDTLYGLLSDAILGAGLEGELTYAGGGSGNGEKALVEGRQGIAPMSRAMKDDAIAKAKAKGIDVVPHKIALDGVGVFVNKSNPLEKIDMNSLRSIFSCRAGNWEDIPGSTKKGPIKVFRRNDASGTTDTFKSLVKIDAFGSCVTVLPETADISAITSKDSEALAYSGLSAGTDKNKALSVAADASATWYLPTIANIRTFNYPLSRFLYVYEAKGALVPSVAEAALLEKVLDRGFMDPIVQSNEFFTLD